MTAESAAKIASAVRKFCHAKARDELANWRNPPLPSKCRQRKKRREPWPHAEVLDIDLLR